MFFITFAVSFSSAQTSRSSQKKDTITLKGDTLREVVVTARSLRGLNSGARIDRSAMEHLQPTSFSDILELLPGHISLDPSMGSVNSILLRETGTSFSNGNHISNTDYSISSLGTLFVVDGAPINGDANLQNIPDNAGDGTVSSSARNTTNMGVDMRSISTDNIESVEIVQGIPSVEYGNLTSGLVNIRRIRRATPLTARFKADEYSKLFSVGKGLGIGERTILNLDLSYLDSKVDPRNNFENYKRITTSARLNSQKDFTKGLLTWNVGADYTGTIDKEKQDPDLSYSKVDEFRSSYNRIALTNELQYAFKHLTWLERIAFNMSASYQSDRLKRRKVTAPRRASVAPTTMEEGEHDGQYLLSQYVADYLCDGKPVNIFAKLKANGSLEIGKWQTNHKLGAEWTFSKNYGKGQVYDLTKPLTASWTTRPRAYKDIPGFHVLSLYAEENISRELLGGKFELQAGVRTTSLLGLSSDYYISGRMFADPRVNLAWHLPAMANGDLKLFIAGGYGITTKMPTVDYLFPQVHYDDITQLNYYDINNPTEHSRVSLRTYKEDATNYNLHPARNHKWEIRFGAEYKGNHFTLTYFDERLDDGFRYSANYTTREYKKYDASGINTNTLTAPPDLSTLPYTVRQVLRGYSFVTNGSSIHKQGVEFQFTTVRWKALRTALTVTGAWFKTKYNNSQMLYETVSDVVDNEAISDTYVGLYDTNEGRVNEQLNTNFMFDTQVPRWGFIFTTTVQCMWYTKTTRLWENGTPVMYLSAKDGELHEYTTSDASDYYLKYLVKTYNEANFVPQRVPIAMYINLKATKRVGKNLKVAMFVNRIIDYLPDYKSGSLTIRRASSPYFGMELNFNI